MLNQLRNSYKFWNHPIFTKPKGAIRPPQNGTISYKQATHFRDFAESYFSIDPIDANEIRLRKPTDEVADVTSVADHSFEALKIATENKKLFEKSFLQSSQDLPEFLLYRFLAYLIKNKEYDKLILFIDKIKKSIRRNTSILLPIYAYIASVCQGLESEEFKNIQDIECSSINRFEQKHFNHFFDELCTLPSGEGYPTLLHLFVGDIDDAIVAFSSSPHIIPILTSTDSFLFYLRTSMCKNICKNLISARYKALRSIPKLIPTEDENDLEEETKK